MLSDRDPHQAPADGRTPAGHAARLRADLSATARLRDSAQPVRQHHRAHADRDARDSESLGAFQARRRSAADAGAVQPADGDAAGDAPGRLLVGRVHLHLQPDARHLQPQQRELRAALRGTGADHWHASAAASASATSARPTTPSKARTCGSARSSSTSSTPTAAADGRRRRGRRRHAAESGVRGGHHRGGAGART